MTQNAVGINGYYSSAGTKFFPNSTAGNYRASSQSIADLIIIDVLETK
jgi:hypothetical protein